MHMFCKTELCQQFMKNNLPQRQLEYNIGLVKYENPKQKDEFDLSTIHSLLIDQNPKFIDLRQLIVDYNANETNRKVNRPNLQRPFIQRLYKMMSELTRISKSQNQLAFLNKIHAWAFHSNQDDDFPIGHEAQDKLLRPGTASTKTRPYSAYTKKSRPDSAIPSKQSIPSTKRTIDSETVSKKVMQQHPKVDFKQLKHGQKQFFLGYRTLHPEQVHPRIKLKQFHNNLLQDEDEKFKQFVQTKPKHHKHKNQNKLLQIPLHQQIILQQQQIDQLIKEGQPGQGQGQVQLGPDGQPLEPAQGQEGQEGADGQGIGEDVNIDDIPGEDGAEGGQPEPEEEEVQVVDKLRPRVKVYGDQIDQMQEDQVEREKRGFRRDFGERNRYVMAVQEDKIMADMMQVWAAAKNRVKNQQRRRAESARMITKRTGIPFQKYNIQKTQDVKGVQIFDLTSAKVPQTKVLTRPQTAIKAHSTRVYNESIQNAILTGKLDKHLPMQQAQTVVTLEQGSRMGTFATKPKKKTFEQILKQAEQKVTQQTAQQIEQIKQKLTINRIALGANKIYKSLSHHEPELLDGEFVGQIVGQGMINNPFFKVAKKKKKKKKK